VRSHERFRVVAEDEFFQGVGLDWTGATVPVQHGGRRRRMTGVAVLLGAVGATAGVSATSLSSRTARTLRPGAIAALPRVQPSAGAARARDLVAGIASRVARRRDRLGIGRHWPRRAAVVRARGAVDAPGTVRATGVIPAKGAVRAAGAARRPRLRTMRSSARMVVDAIRPVAAEPAVVARRELNATTSGGAAARSRTRESEFGFER
jgi:hypothetical protein